MHICMYSTYIFYILATYNTVYCILYMLTAYTLPIHYLNSTVTKR